jgi:predicted dehydrogenase
MSHGVNRRAFSRTAVSAATVVATAASLAPGRVLGANEQVRLGFIGVGNRGCQLLKGFLAQSDAKVVALCDVYEPYLNGAYDHVDPRFAGLGKRIPQMPAIAGDVARVKDFREVLDRKDVDAVVIATPDHWHAIQMIAACKAGKDVYVEKPLSVTIAEGRAMVDAARKYERIAQVGTHRRSSRMFAQLAEVVQSGAIGKVTVARAAFTNNMSPTGIGHAPESDPPAGLDWDMWLGPRPARAFQSTIMPYKFRWWHPYSSQMANWGVHYFDLIRWLTGELAPASVSAHGGRYAVDDDRTIPDTSEAIFEHASKMLAVFSIYEANGQPVLGRGAEVELRGTIGTIYAATNRYEIVPERGGAFQDPAPRGKNVAAKSNDGDLDQQAARDFIDCVKSRKRPNADIEEGHRSTTFAHLANIALATRQRLDWDSRAERFTNCDAANQLLHYEYRKPWSLA